MTENNFEKLLTIDVNSKVEEKQNTKYLSWTYAWSEFKKQCPDASYRVLNNEEGLPYFHSSIGLMVRTEVTANGETLPMWLPCMNEAMKAYKIEAYSYKVKEYEQGKPTGKMIEKWVEPITMVNVNKSIMRCFTKNIAMFGLGLYIFSGEDAPEPETVDSHQLQAILDAIKEKGLTLKFVTNSWQIEKLAHLYSNNFDNILEWIAGQNENNN